MKKYLILILSMSALVLSSCHKEGRWDEGRVKANIMGSYLLVGAYWSGNPIDLDGDGCPRKNLFSEFRNLPEAEPVTSTVHSHVRENQIGLYIPLQHVVFEDDRYLTELMYGDKLSIAFLYTVNEQDGSIIAQDIPYLNLTNTGRIDMEELKNARIVSVQNGQVVMSIDVSFYDRMKEELVAGTMECTYKKVSSDIK